MKSSGLRKPPLPSPAVSPRRLRPSRALRSGSYCQTRPASCQNNDQLSDQQQQMVLEEAGLCPAYQTIAVELHKLARRVKEQFGRSPDSTTPVASQLGQLNRRSPLFERGRHYQEYATRRNDRLSRRRNGEMTVTNGGRDLGVVVGSETTKKRTTKRSNSLRKSMPMEFLVGRSSSSTYNLRSSLRSSTETLKKPLSPAYAGTSLDYDVLDVDKKRTPATRSRKLI